MESRARIQLTFALLLVCCSCQATREHMRDHSLKYVAHRAYSLSSNPGDCEPHSRDFRAGWEQAYYNVSTGQSECPPTVPPECYWGTRFETGVGRERVAAWFRGYQYGAAAALCAGRDQLNSLTTGPPCERARVCESDLESCNCSSKEIFYLPPVVSNDCGECLTAP